MGLGSHHSPQFGTTGVVLNATPTVVNTFFQHVFTWPTRHKSRNAPSGSESPTSIGTLPANQMSYDQGLHVVKQFLNYASEHGVEELQGFSAQPLPIPHWLRREVVKVPQENIERATNILTEQLSKYGGGKGLELVGGKKWWQVRGRPLEGEWIEMSKHYQRRMEREAAAGQTNGTERADKRKSWRHSTLGSLTSRTKPVLDGSGAEVDTDRVIMYIHGGAFFFSSLDLHRYQIERHARKAGARAFVPNYRLSPQYPFPCGLLDSLAAYLYLIDPPEGKPIDPANIILMGDSAGGGMCLSLLVVIREMGLPMPAAASLMSPWVDLTHSMPSINQWDGGDYIPSVGFHYRPSLVWPPLPVPDNGVKVKLADGSEKEVDDQIQLYCPNNLLTHPLVSPINNGSLGGLCPLYITAGSAELLRDEVIYAAHKAADPPAYPPSPETLGEYPEQAALVDKYPPTKVHLQVFEGACHVATTLAWTRSAKYIFRGTANFNIWAFKRAEKRRQRSVLGGAEVSEPLSMSRSGSEGAPTPQRQLSFGMTPAGSGATDEELSDGTASDPESPSATPTRRYFGRHKPLDHMQVRGVEPRSSAPIVAERVSLHGKITPMEPDAEVQALNPKLRDRVGRIRSDGPIGRWLEKRAAWDARWPDRLAKYRDIRAKDRAQAEKQGFLTGTLQGEHPPPSALAGMADPELARKVGKSVDEPTSKTTVPVLLWSTLASKKDAEAAESDSESEKEKGGGLARIISGRPKEKEVREDGGSGRADSEKALAEGVEAEDRKMSTAGHEPRSTTPSALAAGTVATGTAVATSVATATGSPESAPHTRVSLDGERGEPLSRVSTNASEYVLASEVFDAEPVGNGDVRETVVTTTIERAGAEEYDAPSGVSATDYATTPAAVPASTAAATASTAAAAPAVVGTTPAVVGTTPAVADEGADKTPVNGEGTSHLSGTTATPSALRASSDDTTATSEKPNGAADATPVSKVDENAAVEKAPANGVEPVNEKANGSAEKPAAHVKSTTKKGISDEYVDLPRKGVMGKLCC